AYRDRSQVFSGLSAFAPASFRLSGDDGAERLPGAIVTSDYFSTLGVEAALGRVFLPADDQSQASPPVAVVSHTLWQRRFGADPAIVGRTIKLNAHQFTIIGVAPPNFRGTGSLDVADVWTPLTTTAQALPGLSGLLKGKGLRIIGRLKPGVTATQAEAEANLIAAQLRQVLPEEYNSTTGVRLGSGIGLEPDDREEAVRFLGLIMAVVGLVLLIACANVANLLLARATTRRKEVAVRLALGASRLRVIRQFLTESLLIAALGAAFGFLIPYATRGWLLSLFAQALDPASLDFSLDHRIVVFTVALSLATVLLFGLAPAIQASKPDLVPELKDGVFAGGSRRWRLGNVFVVAQIAISLVLLAGAGLMIRTLQKVYAVEPGFETANMLTLTFDLNPQDYTERQGREFYRRLLERAAAIPGVKAAGLASILPLGWGTNSREVIIAGQQPRPDSLPLIVDHNVVTPGYFQLMGTPLVAGRDFNEQDTAEASGAGGGVVIINEAMARRFWPDRNPIGHGFELGGRARRAFEIIGVARNSKFYNLQEESRPVMYLPLFQNHVSHVTLQLRTAVEPLSLVAAVRREARQLDPNLPFTEIKTFDQRLDDSVWPQRTMSTLVVLFGALALALAAMGLYGTLSYTVGQRTREIAIRTALGAQRGEVFRLVIRQGLKLALIGCAIGLPAAFALARLMSGFLYGVSANDPLTFTLITASLGGVALTACYLPARRAMKVDPMAALRSE
ncbi:MAG: ABC transporter permease, partial [Blastocatellia bacterium]